MRFLIFICVSLAFLSVVSVAKKDKKKKKKLGKMVQVPEALNADSSDQDIQASINALWAKVNKMGNGVQIHLHGMGDAHARMDEEREGTHVHLHMHLEDDGHPRHRGGRHGHPGNDTEEYAYAVCKVAGNSALPQDERQPINGNIYFRQKHFGHLEIKVQLDGFDTAGNHSGHVHGLHVHEYGDMSEGCGSMGSHFDPDGSDHGGPDSDNRHGGDYGNIECDENGVVRKKFFDHHTQLFGRYSVLGRGLVIHKSEDNLSHSSSAGDRLACCVVVGTKIENWDSLLGEHEKLITADDKNHHEHDHGHGHHGHGHGHGHEHGHGHDNEGDGHHDHEDKDKPHGKRGKGHRKRKPY